MQAVDLYVSTDLRTMTAVWMGPHDNCERKRANRTDGRSGHRKQNTNVAGGSAHFCADETNQPKVILRGEGQFRSVLRWRVQ